MWTIYLGDRKDIPERAFIRRITGISPTMIATIDAGKEDEQTHGIPVTIGVQATLTLEVELSRLLTSVLCETIGLEGRKSREVSADAQLSEVDIVREIQCYGVVKRDSSGVLCELDLVDTRPDYYGMLSDISRDRQ